MISTVAKLAQNIGLVIDLLANAAARSTTTTQTTVKQAEGEGPKAHAHHGGSHQSSPTSSRTSTRAMSPTRYVTLTTRGALSDDVPSPPREWPSSTKDAVGDSLTEVTISEPPASVVLVEKLSMWMLFHIRKTAD